MLDETEGPLLDRFVQGDADALEALFRRFEREVYGWILRIVRDPHGAENALVETFWRAYRSRARFDTSRPIGAWLRRIATHAALDELKRRGRETGWSGDDVPARTGTSVAAHELQDAIRNAFRKLPPKLRVAASLALVEERSHAEIAAALELPIGTVKSRVFRAIRALRAELARLGVR
jgi:RNA polymerase sigma-70 factor, ECF subfamily